MKDIRTITRAAMAVLVLSLTIGLGFGRDNGPDVKAQAIATQSVYAKTFDDGKSHLAITAFNAPDGSGIQITFSYQNAAVERTLTIPVATLRTSGKSVLVDFFSGIDRDFLRYVRATLLDTLGAIDKIRSGDEPLGAGGDPTCDDCCHLWRCCDSGEILCCLLAALCDLFAGF